MNLPVRQELMRFLLVGGLNTALSYAVYLLLLPVASYAIAYTAAYAAALGLSYLLHTAFVFRVRRTLIGALAYPLVYLAQYLVGLIVLDVAIRFLAVPKPLALLVSVAVTIPMTFALVRWVLGPGRKTGG